MKQKDIRRMSNMAQAFTKKKSITLAGIKSSKPRVCVRIDPSKKGTIIEEGVEISGILWDDGFKEYVPNKYFTRLKI